MKAFMQTIGYDFYYGGRWEHKDAPPVEFRLFRWKPEARSWLDEMRHQGHRTSWFKMRQPSTPIRRWLYRDSSVRSFDRTQLKSGKWFWLVWPSLDELGDAPDDYRPDRVIAAGLANSPTQAEEDAQAVDTSRSSIIRPGIASAVLSRVPSYSALLSLIEAKERQTRLWSGYSEDLTLLGLSPTASPLEVRLAYRQQATMHHPDAGGNTNSFKQIDAAYRRLAERIGS